MLALVHLHRIFFLCYKMEIPTFGHNKHVILGITTIRSVKRRGELGFGLGMARGRGIGYNHHLSFLPFDFSPLSSRQHFAFVLAFHIPLLRGIRRVCLATCWILRGPTCSATLAGASAIHRIVLCAIRITTSFVSHASKRIGSALASFLHRILGGAEGV